MNKDWSGNVRTTWATLGASNHSDHDREEHDFYATEPKAAYLLLQEERFEGTIWENCCGMGHLSEPMKAQGYTVISTDLIDRGYGQGGVDFFKCTETMGDNIVTNPPYKFAKKWVEHSLRLLKDGKKLALFLPIQFLESADRYSLLHDSPPRTVYCASNRLLCAMNGDFRAKDKQGNVEYDRNGNPKIMSSAKFYAWYVWEKGNYSNIEVKFINTTKEKTEWDLKPETLCS